MMKATATILKIQIHTTKTIKIKVITTKVRITSRVVIRKTSDISSRMVLAAIMMSRKFSRKFAVTQLVNKFTAATTMLILATHTSKMVGTTRATSKATKMSTTMTNTMIKERLLQVSSLSTAKVAMELNPSAVDMILKKTRKPSAISP